jgi:outer membrane receptor protein involved in Fe transport
MRFSRFLAVLAMMLLASVGVFAQSTTTGALTGTVTSDGAPLPGATITVTSPQAQGSRTAISDANGNYNIPGLPPGDYTVRVELQGLQPVTRTARVTLAGTSRVDADLRVSAVTEAITVTATAPATLETQEIQTNFDADMVENLPVARTLIGTVNLAPGVTQSGPGGATTISGGFAYDSTYTVDGAVVNEVLRGQPQNLFIEDAIQETTVQTGAISAEFGRFTGGVVTAITKSGGNEFSGSIRDNLNDPTWTAQGALNEPRPESDIVNTYEATLGGFFLRDRLWFFTAGRQFEYGTQRSLATPFAGEIPGTYDATEEETRLEFKLTGQITPRHTLAGTWFDIDRQQFNPVELGGTPLYYESKALGGPRSLPNRFLTFNYNGIITDNLLIEGLWAKQDFSFVGAGAEAAATPERGTNIFLPDGGIIGYPTFCGSCSFPEERNNNNGKLKASYFLSSAGLGTHNLSAGYEFYEDMLKSDNHQSASDFTVYTYETSFLDGHAPDGEIYSRGPNGEILTSVPSGGAFIIYWPILESAKGNSFRTNSFFVNDKWDFNQKLSFNLGARYDQNKGEDNAGNAVADDDNISPRLGLTYDVFGNGRVRANASYSIYASKVANGNVGDAASPAGSPSLLYWLYYGPDINNATSDQLLDQMFGWFRSVGYTDYKDWLLGGGSGGISTQIREKLQTPSMREFSFGVGTQVGSNGFVRIDFQDREWDNYYSSEVSTEIGTVFDPLAGEDLDLTLVSNSDDFTRKYRAVLLQGSYRLFNRLNLGGNYTWSELEGNITGETGGAGPATGAGDNFYKEYTGFAQNSPIGLLPQDQTHKLRLWASYDIPTPVGTFNVSALQRFDSGTAYSAIGVINPTLACCDDAGELVERENPGYIDPPTSVNYYFTDRGALRTDDLTATDLALNYNLPIGRVNIFAQGEVLNVFNDQAIITPDATVAVLRPFDPFTQTPQECPQGTATADCLTMFPTGGVWRKGTNFGKGTLATTGASLLPGGQNGSFQLPRTYRVSFGVRF